MKSGRIDFADNDTLIRLLSGEAAIISVGAEIEAFRVRCGVQHDTLTSLDYFLPWTRVWDAQPVVVMVHRQNTIAGLVFFHLRREHGIPIGIARAGDGTGGGSIVADRIDRTELLELASCAVFKGFAVHTIFISVSLLSGVGSSKSKSAKRVAGAWNFQLSNYRLSLAGGYEATMGRLGYKMRRNLRYYRKRAIADLGCTFAYDLSAAERQEAVATLYSKVTFPYSFRQAFDFESFLNSRVGHFAIGLKTSDGRWMSYIAGWRSGAATYVEWQLNDPEYSRYSLSTVIRSFLIESETARGAGYVVFVGGTSEMWSRVCEPNLCGELVATRAGVIGALTRRLTILLRPQGKLAHLHRTAISFAAQAGRR